MICFGLLQLEPQLELHVTIDFQIARSHLSLGNSGMILGFHPSHELLTK